MVYHRSLCYSIFKLNFFEKNDSANCQDVNVYGNEKEIRCYPLLLNYGHDCCQNAQSRNCQTGIHYGLRQCLKLDTWIFDNDQDFQERNKYILSRKRGAGYWLWKPYIISKELYHARDGDIIIYSDAAVDFIANVSYMLKLVEQQDIILFEVPGKESQYTKRDTFVIMNADELQFTSSTCTAASYIIVKKSWKSTRFINEWLTYAQDSRAITDDKNLLGKDNYDDFLDHRHDQSILSLLVKKWKLLTFPDPSQFGDRQSKPDDDEFLPVCGDFDQRQYRV
ncbi:unnamed protein product [Didymodactylos carnosus]|uniref:Uncharacterized protein n=1 Tax=Didymodactylos carnosus TaxID=1234261 RepID=A0A813ZGS4_9BILA|nr:unnamed protein product [Didymodactylos carnosus]CAF0898285.1 unnamed protein product [Didymodactylos carnosus]CAF3501210.1 unnamed protein product [Didymodactylos carnosus]CAF3681185.1 unnamed protein product [Didymodactylos carnosus]